MVTAADLHTNTVLVLASLPSCPSTLINYLLNYLCTEARNVICSLYSTRVNWSVVWGFPAQIKQLKNCHILDRLLPVKSITLHTFQCRLFAPLLLKLSSTLLGRFDTRFWSVGISAHSASRALLRSGTHIRWGGLKYSYVHVQDTRVLPLQPWQTMSLSYCRAGTCLGRTVLVMWYMLQDTMKGGGVSRSVS